MTESSSNALQPWLSKFKKITGMDRAIAYTVGARAAQITGSTGTVLLIIRFMTPVEQGYYYTLLSLVALQTIFELGFSFVILQMAAHESIHLAFYPDGRVEGDPVAHGRLASVLQKTMRWYLLASVVMIVTLLPLGFAFFSRHSRASAGVAWQGPWIFAVVATVSLFILNPFFSFLEGCGQVRQVAGMRLTQGAAAIVIPCSVMLAGHGLYAPGAVNLGCFLVGFAFLWSRRRILISLLRYAVAEYAIAWRKEVWPFQWQTGISFLCSYFTVQILTPVLFAFRGPIDAGRMGLSMSIAGYLWTIVIAWMYTKAMPFGTLIARGEIEELDRLFFQTLKPSFSLLTIIVVSCMLCLFGVQRTYPKLASRMVSLELFILLLLTAMSTFLVQSMAIYLRARKIEPFLWQSIIVAGLTCGGALLLAPHWGTTGVAVTYFFSSGVIGLSLAVRIFRATRRATYIAAAAPTALKG